MKHDDKLNIVGESNEQEMTKKKHLPWQIWPFVAAVAIAIVAMGAFIGHQAGQRLSPENLVSQTDKIEGDSETSNGQIDNSEQVNSDNNDRQDDENVQSSDLLTTDSNSNDVDENDHSTSGIEFEINGNKITIKNTIGDDYFDEFKVSKDKLEENDQILDDTNELLQIEEDIDTAQLMKDLEQQFYDLYMTINNNFNLVRSGQTGVILYDTIDSFHTGQLQDDYGLSMTELQDHLRYCLFYGIGHSNYELQTPNLYQGYLSRLEKAEYGKYDNGYHPGKSIQDVTIEQETKDFGNNIQSQLTVTVKDKTETVKIYLTVFRDENGENYYKFLDIETVN